VHECARTPSDRARRKRRRNKWLLEKSATAAPQPFMFHYRVYGPVLRSLVMQAQDDLAKS